MWYWEFQIFYQIVNSNGSTSTFFQSALCRLCVNITPNYLQCYFCEKWWYVVVGGKPGRQSLHKSRLLLNGDIKAALLPRERQISTKCESCDAAHVFPHGPERRMCDRARKGDPSLLSRECSARKRMAAPSKFIFDTSVGDKYPTPFVVARLGNPYE
jgi:hypothetical protein